MIDNQSADVIPSTLLLNIVGGQESISVSEDVLLTYLNEAGHWDNGTYHGPQEKNERILSRLKISDDELVRAKDKWLSVVKESAESGKLYSEPGLISVLFRWGQLGEDEYGQVKQFIQRSDDDQLKLLVSLYDGHGLEGFEKFIVDAGCFIDRIQKIEFDDEKTKEIANKMVDYLNHKDVKEEDTSGELPKDTSNLQEIK